MRFEINFEVDSKEIYKDKNKIFASWMKYYMKSYDAEMYKNLYESGSVEKNFTFSIYLGTGAKFNRENILINSNKIKMFFSSYGMEDSIKFYNIFTRALYKEFLYKEIKIKAINLSILKDEVFKEDFAYFKTMSPIIVREHREGNNSLNYYHSLNTEEGREVFERNIRSRIINEFSEEITHDLETFFQEVITNKMVTVRHHNINIPSNLCILKICAKAYLLDFLYKSGKVSSLNSSGFGMLELIKK